MKRRINAFTIVELLVVVSIIALLVGILLPAITKARDTALVTQSKSNIRNISVALETYGSEFNDRQFQFLPDNFSRVGVGTQQHGDSPPGNLETAWNRWGDLYGHINILQLLGLDGNLYYAPPRPAGFIPIGYEGKPGESIGFGSFRLPNAGGLNQYFNNRFYDQAFYAPKDKVVMSVVEGIFKADDDEFGEYQDADGNTQLFFSSYCLSPAAIFSPGVLAKKSNGGSFTSPWNLPAAFRSPTNDQARYPTLKTKVMEHHWLQGLGESECNRFFTAASATYDGCEPWFFNHGIQSAPVTAFYDGHIDQIGMNTAMSSHDRVIQQETDAGDDSPMGLWITGVSDAPALGDYYTNFATDWTEVSMHTHTRDGIQGRDVIPQ